MKITAKTIDGIYLTCFRDPSTIYGEWVVSSANFDMRFNNRWWTKKEALQEVANLEKSRDKMAQN